MPYLPDVKNSEKDELDVSGKAYLSQVKLSDALVFPRRRPHVVSGFFIESPF